jgi:Mor family transcriptional regulator
MKTKNHDGRTIAADMIGECGAVVGRDVAVRAIRELCRHFGGQLVYIPVHKTTGKTTEELHGVLRDAAGDRDAALMLEKLMTLYGGCQIYIPMEKKAFHRLIALEIYGKFDGITKTIGDICREYGMSFNTVYKFYYEGRDEKTQGIFDFMEIK